MSSGDRRPRYTVNLDIYVARRTRIHQVTDLEDNAVFHAALLVDVLNWIAEQGATTIRFTDEETNFDVHILRCAPIPET